MAPRVKSPPNVIIAEGIESFPENEDIIAWKTKPVAPLTARELLTHFHRKYHGYDNPGCILVKKRREMTYDEHYLDIYACLTCGLEKECLHSGWEIGWWGGTESKKLK